MIAIILHFWRYLKYRRAAVVNSREELEIALRAAPPRIVVEGNEALRAYAASLAYRGGQKAAELEATAPPSTGSPTYMVVPTVGRIRDGYRSRSRSRSRPEKTKLGIRFKAGMGTVIVAACGIFAALLVEVLSFPAGEPELVRGPHHVGETLIRRHEEARLPTRAPPPPPPSLAAQVAGVLEPLLGFVAISALIYMALQAAGAGKPVKISWKVENRVQGRLVIARVRTRLA